MRSPDVMEALHAQLQDHEGTGPVENGRFFPYDDKTGRRIERGSVVEGCVTIGWGRNLTDDGMSQEEVDTDLEHDLSEAIADLEAACPWVTTLDDVRWRVLVDMTFNMGIGWVRAFQPTLRHVEAGEWADAAYHMRMSKWSRDTGRRAIRLASMMATGIAL